MTIYSDMKEDDEMLDQFMAGDEGAFDKIVVLHRERIFRYLAVMLGDEAMAEDLTQETFTRALKALPKFERRSKLSSWLYQIAINLARKYFRSKASKVQSVDPEILENRNATRRSVLSSVVRRERAEFLAMAIDRLPNTMREPFILHHVEGIRFNEISEITETPVRTLHVRVHRARELLRKQLGPVVDTFWSRKFNDSDQESS